MSPWLVSDVGGTNVRFALADVGATKPLLLESIQSLAVSDFGSLSEAVRSYLVGLPVRPQGAVFALAGRVNDESVKLTNHSWTISAAGLRSDLGLGSIKLVNDFAATSMGLPLLGPGDVLGVGQDVGPTASRAGGRTFCVLGPGTGLGVSALVVRGQAIFALETEGGHVGFAPASVDEVAVLQRLMARFGRVSAERLLCGTGLSNLYMAIGEVSQANLPPLQPEQIVAHANDRSDSHCVRAVEMFCDALGSVAGDFALSYGAWNGVYLAGGLIGHLIPWLRRDSVRRRFIGKGRFAGEMTGVPLLLVTHPQPGLLGAAAIAVLESGGSLLNGGALAEMAR